MSWTPKSLDELGFVGRGKSKHRPRDAAHLYGGDYPFIQTGDVKHSLLYINSYSQTYSDAGLAQSKLWRKGTLCITIAANIAETAILGIDACFPDSVIGFVADENKCDVRFIKYKFDILKRHYQQFSQGAAQDNLSLEKLLSLKIPVPDVHMQREIGEILSAYDDLIANNLKRIALVEESARLLYKEWFVRLRFPGHEHTNIVDGVPEGWERLLFEEALVLQRGFDLPSQEREEGDIPIYGSMGITGYHNKATVCAPGVVTGRSGTLGVVQYVAEDFFPLNTSLWVREFKRVDPIFAFFLLQNLNLEQFNGGASVPTLDRNAVHRLPILIPNKHLLSMFNAYMLPIFAITHNLQNQNQKLKQARDLLLPRLMSGEIAV